MDRLFLNSDFDRFRTMLVHRLRELSVEFTATKFVMPIAILLILDEANGGDETGAELVKRHVYLDRESRNVLDLYFLGWRTHVVAGRAEARFDLVGFIECRRRLAEAGIRSFGGYADLIIVDANYFDGQVDLCFDEAIYVDLKAAIDNKQISSVGAFLESIMRVAGELRNEGALVDSYALRLSNRLSLAIAGRSLLDFLLNKFGEAFGLQKISAIFMRGIGPRIPLREM